MSQIIKAMTKVSDIVLFKEILKQKGITYQDGGIVRGYQGDTQEVDLYLPELNIGYVYDKKEDCYIQKSYDQDYHHNGMCDVLFEYNQAAVEAMAAEQGWVSNKTVDPSTGIVEYEIEIDQTSL